MVLPIHYYAIHLSFFKLRRIVWYITSTSSIPFYFALSERSFQYSERWMNKKSSFWSFFFLFFLSGPANLEANCIWSFYISLCISCVPARYIWKTQTKFCLSVRTSSSVFSLHSLPRLSLAYPGQVKCNRVLFGQSPPSLLPSLVSFLFPWSSDRQNISTQNTKIFVTQILITYLCMLKEEEEGKKSKM